MNIELTLGASGNGAFNLYEADKKTGEMVIQVKSDTLTVFHTEVLPEAEGKGYAAQLLQAMVAYARSHHLKVIPLCPYVHLQLKRHADLYNDIWQKE